MLTKYSDVIFILIVIVFLLSGCATSKFVPTGKSYPPHSGPVQVFYQIPEGYEYEQIGIVTGKGYEGHDWADVIIAMQKKAAKHGANAILIITSETPHYAYISYNKSYGLMGSSGSQKEMISIALIYTIKE